MRAFEFLTNGINPDIQHQSFKHSVEINNFTYTAHIEETPKVKYLVIQCWDEERKVGEVKFYTYGDTLMSAITTVHPDYRRIGIASKMYAYANQIGGDIEPSKHQL